MESKEKYIIIQKIESFQDKFGRNKKIIKGINSYGKVLTFIVEDWVSFKIDDKVEITEENIDNQKKYYISDSSIKHPYFELGKKYLFILVRKFFRDNKTILELKGPDNRLYEHLYSESLHTINKIGAEYEFEFRSIKRGKERLSYKIFYNLERLNKVENIQKYFKELEYIEETELTKQILFQYRQNDNNWIISFLNHIENKLHNSFFRKDWNDFRNIKATYKSLHEWILHSRFLLLYQKTNQEIKNNIHVKSKEIELLSEVVDINLNFHQNDFINNLNLENITDDEQSKLLYILKSNIELTNDIKILTILYNGVINKIFRKDIIYFLFNNLDYKVNHLLKEIKNKKIESTKTLRGEVLNKTLYFLIFIHDGSFIYDIIPKITTYLIRLSTVLEMSELDYPNLIQIKKNILSKKVKNKLIGLSVDISPKYIYDILSQLELIDNEDIIKINEEAVCLVLYKSNHGVLLLTKSNTYGILPRHLISKLLFDDLKINSEIKLIVSLINSDINLFIASLSKVSLDINAIFNDNKILKDYRFNYATGQVIQGSVRKVVDYGVFINLTDTESGLLRINDISSIYAIDIHKWFYENQKINLVVTNYSDGKIDLSQIHLYDNFFDSFNEQKNVNVKIRGVINNQIYLLIDDLYDFFFYKDDIKINEFEDYSLIEQFDCTLIFKNDRFIFTNIHNVINIKTFESLNKFELINIQQLLIEKSYFLEEYIYLIEDTNIKIQLLQWSKTIYSLFSIHRSYFVDYYISYLDIIKDFQFSDIINKNKIGDFIQKINNDTKIKESFELISKLKETAKILSYYEVLSEESLEYLSKIYFLEEFSLLARQILLINLFINESGSSKNILKTKLKKLLLLNSTFTTFEYNIDYDVLGQEESYVFDILAKIKKEGENKHNEFKSSLFTPIQDKIRLEKLKRIEEQILKATTPQHKEKLEKEKNELFSTKPDELVFEVMKNIVAFINTKGGNIYIGINNDGDLIGLQNDYNSIINKNPNKNRTNLNIRDEFLTLLDNYISDWLGNEIVKYIDTKIYSKDNHDFCVITLTENERKKPFAVKHNVVNKNTIKNHNVVFVRSGASARELTTEDLLNIAFN
jgi:predicted RNA-binding protein with RPS1 domain